MKNGEDLSIPLLPMIQAMFITPAIILLLNPMAPQIFLSRIWMCLNVEIMEREPGCGLAIGAN